jgi:glutathione peroxidase
MTPRTSTFTRALTQTGCLLLAGLWPLAGTAQTARPVPTTPVAAPAAAPSTATAAACPSLLQHTLPRLQDEKPVPLCQYAGKVLLVVNTASFCGFTGQYKALEALHARYGPRGLAVLGFPSNDFGKQEPGDNAAIAEFCENTFAVRFPMFAKSVVRAPAASARPDWHSARVRRLAGIFTSTWSVARGHKSSAIPQPWTRSRRNSRPTSNGF